MSSLRSFLFLLLTALSMAVHAAPIAQATNAADIGNITDIEPSSSGSHASGGGQSEGTGNTTGSKEGGSKGGSGDALANVVAPVANGDVSLSFMILLNPPPSQCLETVTNSSCT